MTRPLQTQLAREGPIPFERTILYLLSGLVIFSPLALGVVEAWSELVVEAGAGVLLFLVLLSGLIREECRLRWSWAYVPFGLLLVVALLQAVPLPRSIVQLLSPEAAGLREKLLGETEGAVPLSLYPYGTLKMVRVGLAAFAVFVVAVNVLRCRRFLERFLKVVVVTAGLLSLLAIAQILSGTDKIYWVIPTGHDVAQGGTFVNRNNFCIFVNLSLGAGICLLLLSLERRGKPRYPGRSPARELWEFLSGPRGSATRWLMAACVVMAASVVLSLSRGGAMSLLAGGIVTALIMAGRKSRERRVWLLCFLGLCAFTVVLYAGFDAVYDRLATLQDKEAYRNRWQIVSDILEAFPRFALLGTGLGTHEVVYPLFDRGPWPAIAEYAENEYAQLAEEMGIVGLGLAALFLATLSVSYLRSLGGSRFQRNLAYGVGFSLVAVAIHSFGDFGLHLPANNLLAACLFGALVGTAQQVRPRSGVLNETLLSPGALVGRKIQGVVLLLLVAGLWLWILWQGAGAALAESAWRDALQVERRLSEQGWEGTNDQYAALISRAQKAADLQPGNVKYRYWLAVYRWRAISRVRDSQTGALILTPRHLEFVKRIVGELKGLRSICPTYGPAYCVAGQLEKFVLDLDEGRKLIREGYKLARNNPTACFVAGLVDLTDGRKSEARKKFERALILDPGLFNEILQLLVNRFKEPQLAVELAGGDVARLLRVTRLLERAAPEDRLTSETAARTVAALRKVCEGRTASAYLLATLADFCRRSGDLDEAITYYRRALDRQHGQVGWRLSLARCLAAKGLYEEAIYEARLCLRHRPQFKAAENCIAKWSVAILPEGNSKKK